MRHNEAIFLLGNVYIRASNYRCDMFWHTDGAICEQELGCYSKDLYCFSKGPFTYFRVSPKLEQAQFIVKSQKIYSLFCRIFESISTMSKGISSSKEEECLRCVSFEMCLDRITLLLKLTVVLFALCSFTASEGGGECSSTRNINKK
jgi:hypothetical protein